MGTVTNIASAKPKLKSNRLLQQREFAAALRKIKIHVPQAIQTAAAIMNCSIAKESDRLKASALILEHYTKFVEKTYREDDSGSLVDDNSPNIIVDLTGKSLEQNVQ